MMRFITQDKSLKVVSVAVLVGAWQLLSIFVGSEVLVPSPVSTMGSLVELGSDSGFYITVLYTMARSIGGFLISLLLAVVFGGLAKRFRVFRFLLRPLVDFLGSVPIIAIILLALIWLRNALVPLFVGFLVVFPIMYETVLSSLDGIDKGILQMARVYGVRRSGLVKDIYIPAILFGLSGISASTLSTTLKMVVAGEVLSQPGMSIGTSLQLQRVYLNTSGVFAWIVVILVISKILNALVEKVKTGGRFSRLF